MSVFLWEFPPVGGWSNRGRGTCKIHKGGRSTVHAWLAGCMVQGGRLLAAGLCKAKRAEQGRVRDSTIATAIIPFPGMLSRVSAGIPRPSCTTRHKPETTRIRGARSGSHVAVAVTMEELGGGKTGGSKTREVSSSHGGGRRRHRGPNHCTTRWRAGR